VLNAFAFFFTRTHHAKLITPMFNRFTISQPSVRAFVLLGCLWNGIGGKLLGEEWLPLTPDMATPFVPAGDSGGIQRIAPDDLPMHARAKAPIEFKVPTHAVLNAVLGNWDSDLQPDGWEAQVQLLDKSGSPVVPSQAYAVFELRLLTPSHDRNAFEEVLSKPIRWSMKLEFDVRGLSTVQLPLRTRLPSGPGGGSVHRRLTSHRNPRFEMAEQSGRYVGLANSRSRGVQSQAIANPAWGVIRVRVSVPSVAVLEAIDAVATDELGLTNTAWPTK
jgi:hypothetical protein